ncbi:MAG: DNA-binding protein [Eubacterium sp.]|nr:DNA-binding protein [Eubacterium sp.]
MRENIFITADEVSRTLEISKPYAYKLIKQMNEELRSKGFMTIAGKVSRRFFEEKFYGIGGEERACV